MDALELEKERQINIWAVKRQAAATVFSAHTQAITGFATMAINALILANSAAGGALLAFLAAAWDKKAFMVILAPAIFSLKIFVAGILAAVLAAGASYIAQFCYATTDIQLNDGAARSRWRPWGMGFHIFALAAAIGAIVAFAWGAWAGLDALGSFRPDPAS